MIYVEGDTEACLKPFFKQWLDRNIEPRIEISLVNFAGVGNYLKDFAERAKRDLDRGKVSGIIGLIDYFGSSLPYPHNSVAENYTWAKQRLESLVGNVRFRQHFAVNEIEAWLLSDAEIFPQRIADDLPKAAKPESVNFQNPPCKRIRDLYWRKLERKYKKPTDGAKLFAKLDPDVAGDRCPHLRLLFEDLLQLARNAEQL